MRTQILLALAVLLLLGAVPPVFAQTGRIVGTVVDATSGETLPGANVLVEGTNIGAATNLDGQFVIPSVRPGLQTLRASYVGYTRQQVQVTVVAGGEVTVQIELSWAGVEG